MRIGGVMCREVFFWATEYFNYFSLIFWGIKLFLKKYDVQTGRKEWVENVIITVASVPVILFCVTNYYYVVYSMGVTYAVIIFLYLFLIIYSKKSMKNIFSMVAIYIHVIRLIDLLIVAISLQINRVSRYFNWDFINMGIDRSVFLISLALIYYFVYYILRNNFVIDYLYENNLYRWFICVYSLMGILCFGRVYMFEYTQDIIQYWTFYLVCAFVMFGFFIFYFVRVKVEERNRILNLRNDLMESNYLALQKAYDENRMLSHDFKNHMLAVNQLIHNDEYKAAEEYIQTYIECMAATKRRIESGCKIVDIILNYKITEAMEKSINFKYEVEYIGNICIKDIDMCALLANLLDNAIEACNMIQDNQKWIQLNLKRNNDMLFISLSNSINTTQIEKKKFFETDKKDRGFHGLGVKSIENVVNKYEGYKEYKISKNEFNVFVSLPLD